jgi:hypothetical protein
MVARIGGIRWQPAQRPESAKPRSPATRSPVAHGQRQAGGRRYARTRSRQLNQVLAGQNSTSTAAATATAVTDGDGAAHSSAQNNHFCAASMQLRYASFGLQWAGVCAFSCSLASLSVMPGLGADAPGSHVLPRPGGLTRRRPAFAVTFPGFVSGSGAWH